MICHSIQEVLNELDSIVETSIRSENPIGIFAYIYRRTTAQIKEAIDKGEFEDNERMIKLDVAFANLYLSAYENYRMNRMISACWQTAFDARQDKITIIQHIMLGMNAHINLDLGVAACSVMDGNDIHGLEKDFMKVNDILATLVDEMQSKLSKVSRFMFLLDWLGKRKDEDIINFSMSEARRQSWRNAVFFSESTDKERSTKIAVADRVVDQFARIILRPDSWALRKALGVIAYFEEEDIAKIIAGLESPVKNFPTV